MAAIGTLALTGCLGTNTPEASRAELSDQDERGFQKYEDGFTLSREALADYEAGWQTYIENVPRDSTSIRGDYPADWPELSARMRGAAETFREASNLFDEARTVGESPEFNEPSIRAVEWVEAHMEVLDWFGELGGPPRRRAIQLHRAAKTAVAPLTPQDLLEVVLGRKTPNFETPSVTFTPIPTREPTPTEPEERTETRTPTPDPHPDQPKIREIQDNFGHTLTFERNTSEQVHVGDEIVVTDDTELELCVTGVAKQEGDEVDYQFTFGHHSEAHPDNHRGWVSDNCHSWEIVREDYTSRWSVSIHIRNQDEISYQNPDVESDYRVVVHYDNLTLG